MVQEFDDARVHNPIIDVVAISPGSQNTPGRQALKEGSGFLEFMLLN